MIGSKPKLEYVPEKLHKGNCSVLAAVEKMRVKVSRSTDASKKSKLGQFLTPAATAEFMAGMFTNIEGKNCRLLDAGAGIGSLTCAFLDRCFTGNMRFERLDIEAFEIDELLHAELEQSISGFSKCLALNYEIVPKDFVEEATHRIIYRYGCNFTHAILNPPYKKIASDSRYRGVLRDVKIETVNLYSAFVALTIALMEKGGQLVAIIPRSFCNGPYYRPFRDYLCRKTAIRRMHLFDSRNRNFKDDTGKKWGFFDQKLLASLGVTVGSHGKMPDVVIYFRAKNWLILAEAVTSGGPVDGCRHKELADLFKTARAGLVFVTAFPDRGEIFRRFQSAVAWETEVWCASDPTHLIHFNGIRFLGPYASRTRSP